MPKQGLPPWRRIAELDPYSDEQCRCFAAIAIGTPVRRVARWCLAILLSIVVAVPLAALSGLSSTLSMPSWVTTALMAIAAVPFCLFPLTALLIHDRLVRARIRSVYQKGARCKRCKTPLALQLGTAPPAHCSQCGAAAVPPPAFAALLSSHRQTIALVAQHNRKRQRTIMTVLSGLIAIAVSIREAMLQQQSRRAAAHIGSAATILAQAAGNATAKPSTGAPAAWIALFQADQLRSTNHPPGDSSLRTTRLDLIYDAPPPPTDEFDLRAFQKRREEALQAVEHARSCGAFDVFDRLADDASIELPMPLPSNLPLLAQLPEDELATARHFSRLNQARLALAIESGDNQECIMALRSCMRLSRMCERFPGTFGSMVSLASEWRANLLAWRNLDAHPPRDVVVGIGEHLRHESVLPGLLRAIESERLLQLDLIARVFANPDQTRFGCLSIRHPAHELWIMPNVWLGSFDDTMSTLNDYVARVTSELSLLPSTRNQNAFEPPTTSLALLWMDAPYFGKAINGSLQSDLFRSANPIRIAIELYYSEHQRYPDALDELVPTYLAALPIDPLNAQPFKYRLVQTEDGVPNTSFILYSTGLDATDDGGVEDPQNPWRAIHRRTAPTVDFVLNHDH